MRGERELEPEWLVLVFRFGGAETGLPSILAFGTVPLADGVVELLALSLVTQGVQLAIELCIELVLLDERLVNCVGIVQGPVRVNSGSDEDPAVHYFDDAPWGLGVRDLCALHLEVLLGGQPEHHTPERCTDARRECAGSGGLELLHEARFFVDVCDVVAAVDVGVGRATPRARESHSALEAAELRGAPDVGGVVAEQVELCEGIVLIAVETVGTVDDLRGG